MARAFTPDGEDEEHDEDEKLVQAKTKYTKPSPARPRENTRAERAKRLAGMGYDTNEEVDMDYEP